jgi:hypothetical protein
MSIAQTRTDAPPPRAAALAAVAWSVAKRRSGKSTLAAVIAIAAARKSPEREEPA